MSLTFKKSFRLAAIALMSLASAARLSATPIAIAIVPASQNGVLGSPATVSLQITGLGDHVSPSVGTFDLTVNYNPAILGFNSFVFGDPVLGDQLDPFGLGSITNVNPSSGSVEVLEVSLDSTDDLNNLQAPAFILGVLKFNTLGLGSSSLGLVETALADASGGALSATLTGGSITVRTSLVPEPGTFLAFTSGLAALIFCGWRRRRGV
jgi:hypothetical protein